jgi:hypothetical protein
MSREPSLPPKRPLAARRRPDKPKRCFGRAVRRSAGRAEAKGGAAWTVGPYPARAPLGGRGIAAAPREGRPRPDLPTVKSGGTVRAERPPGRCAETAIRMPRFPRRQLIAQGRNRMAAFRPLSSLPKSLLTRKDSARRCPNARVTARTPHQRPSRPRAASTGPQSSTSSRTGGTSTFGPHRQPQRRRPLLQRLDLLAHPPRRRSACRSTSCASRSAPRWSPDRRRGRPSHPRLTFTPRPPDWAYALCMHCA